jgi:hypothetical protein
MPSLPKQLVIFTLRERRYAARPRCQGGAYLAKDNLATDLIPAVAAAIGVPPATELGTS